MAHAIFLVARLLADKYNRGRSRTFAENRLGRGLVKIASPAILHRFPQQRQRLFSGHEISGGIRSRFFHRSSLHLILALKTS